MNKKIKVHNDFYDLVNGSQNGGNALKRALLFDSHSTYSYTYINPPVVSPEVSLPVWRFERQRVVFILQMSKGEPMWVEDLRCGSAFSVAQIKEKMNTQQKTFINFDEIAAFRFRCKTCAIELTVPFGTDFTRTKTAHKCPGCGDSWLCVNDGSAVPALANFVQAIKTISQWPGQCEVTVEISTEQQ